MKQLSNTYYSGKVWSDGYHAWGDHGISLMFPISAERTCDDFGTEKYMCPCASKDTDGNVLLETKQSLRDNIQQIIKIKVTASGENNPSILDKLKPESSFFKDSVNANDSILRGIVSV